MQIQKTDNTPNFGLKYVKPRSWNPELLDTFQNVFLTCQINKAHPNAKVKYRRGIDAHFLDFKFERGAKWKSISENTAEKLIAFIKMANFSELPYRFEQEAAKQQRIEAIYKKAEFSNKSNKTGLWDSIKKVFKK